MSTYMNHELLLFFCSLGTGAGLLFVYDWIRIARQLFPVSAGVASFLDFVFWLTGGICIFILMYQMNDGVIRSYAVLGICIGMGSYRGLVRDAFVKIAVTVGEIPLNFVKKVIKWLIFRSERCRIVLCRLIRRIMSPLRFFLKSVLMKRTRKIGKETKQNKSEKE